MQKNLKEELNYEWGLVNFIAGLIVGSTLTCIVGIFIIWARLGFN